MSLYILTLMTYYQSGYILPLLYPLILTESLLRSVSTIITDPTL